MEVFPPTVDGDRASKRSVGYILISLDQLKISPEQRNHHLHQFFMFYYFFRGPIQLDQFLDELLLREVIGYWFVVRSLRRTTATHKKRLRITVIFAAQRSSQL